MLRPDGEDRSLINSQYYQIDHSTNNLYGSSQQYQPLENHFNQNQNNKLPSNLADISNPQPENIINYLERRFLQGEIYSELSYRIIIALNPFENTLHLSDNQIQHYKQLYLNNTNDHLQNPPPHIYKWAELAQQSCFSPNNVFKRSSIIAQGISGSGKTVTSKHIVSYIAAESQSGTFTSQVLGKVDIERRIISSSQIFESFGNAKTNQNSNSSRFGKIVSIQFKEKNKIRSGKILTTLFERTRVTQKGFKDRNYHIFYQLLVAYHNIQDLKSFDSEINDNYGYSITNLIKEIQQFELDSQFVLLGASIRTPQDQDEKQKIQDQKAQEYEDLENFKLLLLSFFELSFTQADIINILQCVAGLVHLSEDNYKKAEELLKIQNLQENINSNIENLQQNRKLQTENITNGIIMDIYYKLFCWIQEKVNQDLSQEYDPNQKQTLNVFDSFGFEIIEKLEGIQQNQYEQLILNYINEKLTNFFYNNSIQSVEKIFSEQKLLQNFANNFQKNEKVISLIEEAIFNSLKDCHKLDRNTANLKDNISNKSKEKYNEVLIDESQLKTKRQLLTESQNRHKFQDNIIGIRHTGEEVYYQLEGFLQRNKYTVNENIQRINKQSRNPIISSFPLQAQNQTVSDNSLTVTNDLIKMLKDSEVWFVKCMQTNFEQKPKKFDQQAILRQLKLSGIEQSARFFSQSYYLNIPNKEFFNFYSSIYENINDEQKFKGFLRQNFREVIESVSGEPIYYGSNDILIKEKVKEAIDEYKSRLSSGLPYDRSQKQYDEQSEELNAKNEEIRKLKEILQITQKEVQHHKQLAENFKKALDQILNVTQNLASINNQKLAEIIKLSNSTNQQTNLLQSSDQIQEQYQQNTAGLLQNQY